MRICREGIVERIDEISNASRLPLSDFEKRHLAVYPNPALDLISVETEADEVEIIDVLGRVVLRTRTDAPIDETSLPVGVYVVRADARSRVFTIVK